MEIFRRKKNDETNGMIEVSPRIIKPNETPEINQITDSNQVTEYKIKSKMKLDDFLVMTTLGTGTFGRVRLVKHIETGEFYALKILKKSEIIRLQQYHHIKCEVFILSSIQHPFIVNYINHFQDDKRIYVVLQYIQGGELFTYLRKEGKLSDDVSRLYISQLILAISYLHQMDIIYRDLKPENLLISSNGYLKITDFGFAKIVQDRTWTLCGTPEYLAPEIIQSKGHGKSVDWWALGILLYEMLAGYPPFYDENPFGIYQKILKGKIEYPKYIDSKAKDLIKKLLQQDRTKRIGCLKGGAEDVRKHKYFTKIDWNSILNQTIQMEYVPTITGPGDHQNFDAYPDSPKDIALPLTESDKEAFSEFEKF